MFKLKNYLSKYKKYLVIGPLFKALETASDIITPYLMAIVIDRGISEANTTLIYGLCGIIIAMNLLSFLFAIVCQKSSSLAQSYISRDIRHDMFSHINTYSHAELDKFSTVTLTNRAIHDVSQISNAVGMTIRSVARAPFLAIGSFVMACFIDLKLSLIFIVIMPLLIFVVMFIMNKNSPLYAKLKVELDDVTDVARDNLDSVRVVRAFNKQEYEANRFTKANKKFTGVNVDIAKMASILQPLIALIINLGVIAVLWFGGIRVNAGIITTGNLIAFVNYLLSLANSLVVIARLIIVYNRTGASMKRVKEVFETKNTILDPARPVEFDPENFEGDIEFKNVWFSYNNSKDAVKNLSIKIKAGQVIGIIGGTGSGKSSVVNLIPRFYDVTRGEVLVDGVNVKKYRVEDLRSMIGIVPQNPTLFEGTLLENMRFRKKDATESEVIKALKISQSYDFVSELPDFLNHEVFRGGSNFSGGQRQRLTIARALVGEPKILILDDSSSALDFATDAKLRKAIGTSLKNSTIIIVSQRATTLMSADNIIVLDNGDVCGIGTHEELLKNCTTYQEIYYSQNPEEEENK